MFVEGLMCLGLSMFEVMTGTAAILKGIQNGYKYLHWSYSAEDLV